MESDFSKAHPNVSPGVPANAPNNAPANALHNAVVENWQCHNETLVQRFETQAALHAERLAVLAVDEISIDGTSSTRCHAPWTYNALNEAANRIAHAVGLHFGGDFDVASLPVALLLNKDAPLFAAMLGVLKSGGFFVALDRAHPEAHNRSVIENAGATLLFTDSANMETALRLASKNLAVVNVHDFLFAESSHRNAQIQRVAAESGAAAYVTYTSGSTGQPKGVIDTHRIVLHHVERYAQALGFSCADRVALLASCSVGQGMKTVWSALLMGATLCPFDLQTRGMEALATWIKSQKITVYTSVPSVFRRLARHSSTRSDFPELRLVRLGGETLHAEDVELFRARFSSHCRLTNSYSSTETGNVTLFGIDEQTAIHGALVPVGFIAPQTQVRIVDESGAEVGAGEIGEIVVRSAWLSPGYWRDNVLTQQKFQTIEGTAERLYRTGDLGFFSLDGCLHHYGRKDFQIKIRGFRVEPGEIEGALRLHPAVRDVVVVAQPDTRGENCLVAYFVTDFVTKNRELDSEELRGFLAERMPQHLVPTFFVLLEKLPLTLSGKIDRAHLKSQSAGALPRASKNRENFDVVNSDVVKSDAAKSDTEACDEIEKSLMPIWREVLQRSDIKPYDNFFELGGDSLLAVALVIQIEKMLGQQLSTVSFFGNATIAAQAKLLRDKSTFGEHSRDENGDEIQNNFSSKPGVVALQPRTTLPPRRALPPLFFVADMHDSFWCYRHLIASLGEEQPIYGLQTAGVCPESDDVVEFGEDYRLSSTQSLGIVEIAAHYTRALSQFQPHGAVFLCGYSFAGKVAFEVARQLEEQGRTVAFLALLDTSSRANELAMLEPISRRQRQRNHCHIWRKLRRHERRIYLAHYVRARITKRENTAGDLSLQAQIRRNNQLIGYRNRVASASYVTKNYAGQVTLFRAMLGFREERKLDLGWKKVVQNRIDVIEVSGDHATLLDPPHVHFWAEKFREQLHRAQECPESSACIDENQ